MTFKKEKSFPVRARKRDELILKRLGHAVKRDNDYEGYGSTSDALDWLFGNKQIMKIVKRKLR